ncbi:histone-like nucleoid-structuring protein Lsr2 [Microbacterium sp. CFBP 8794]|uniref:histone-like nucleoid-structuring protein Lsr2 n=1 Tax=Microbacterium sp. CFBP 8794 TaxID=2775269 RepID=UPI003140347E
MVLGERTPPTESSTVFAVAPSVPAGTPEGVARRARGEKYRECGCKVFRIMALKHITHLVDDLDGSVLEEGQGKQITFSLEGRTYEIDLSDRNADKFYSAIAPFVDAARSASRGASTTRRARPARRANDVDLGAVREWARANGHTVSDRGRVPGTVLDAYTEAHS